MSFLNEDALIDQIQSKVYQNSSVFCGIGDDCAVFPGEKGFFQLFSTDILLQGTHFLLPPSEEDGVVTFEQLGHKALAVNISDIAAMGGWPEYALVSLAIPDRFSQDDVLKIYEGMTRLCGHFEVSLVGGDLSRSPHDFVINVAIGGKVEKDKLVLRSGAQNGHEIYVTGRLGGSLKSQRHATFWPKIDESSWLVEHVKPSAMMDLSDGLASDLRRIMEKSGLAGAWLDPQRIPLSEGVSVDEALTDGEDFELLFTLPSERASGLRKAPFDWTCVGQFDSALKGLCLKQGQQFSRYLGHGFEHFSV